MSTAMRIGRAGRDKLRRLQEAWRRGHGADLPQKEILERVLEFAEKHQREFLAEAGWRPLTDAEINVLRRRQGHYGRWSVRDLDEIVYGESARPSS